MHLLWNAVDYSLVVLRKKVYMHDPTIKIWIYISETEHRISEEWQLRLMRSLLGTFMQIPLYKCDSEILQTYRAAVVMCPDVLMATY